MQWCRIVIVLALVGVFSPVHIVCQAAAAVMPQDAADLMRLAHDKNGFTGADIRPWHMRGTYHSYKQGKVEYEGQYEEWWFSPTQYKLTFSNPGLTQSDYANGATLLRDGAQEWLSGPELLLHASLVDPLPDAALLVHFKLKRGSRSVDKAKLDCVTLTYKTRTGPEAHNFPSACFESTMPVLRIFEQGFGLAIWYDHIVLVQGRYVAHQIQVFNSGSLMADLNVESIQAPRESPETMITPPASALPVDLSRIAIKPSGNHFWPMPLIVAGADFAPAEPAEAPANKQVVINQDLTYEARAALNPPKMALGTVIFRVRVRPDGHVESAEIVSGIVHLQQPALDAARQWLFRPFAVMGEARPVETEFALGVNWFVP
jgi:hypothetical protein